ncbi:S8 family serine peptidase [Solwaraspora sp. WMMD1047]|uniref:S8 family serine peptidase n=1 Tax=Solwaraspora sp. WMMD1047 TaxID=3016102 RepID=UPI002417D1AC|nr:S8 family serine peptidase [Solwaraspora sp. WMMD1047]MDG4831535.1 S8 family serine peptidase [Solwaraspora sp. WMMD1047]
MWRVAVARPLAVVVAISAAVVVTVAAGPGAVAAGAPSLPGGAARTVTLVTGDRVTVSGGGPLRVQPGQGRAGVRFLTQQDGQRRYVIPHDALGLIQRDRLDRRLFDVTLLLEHGYDRRADLPLIVAYDDAGGARRSGRDGAGVPGATVVRELPAIDGVSMRADRAAMADFWRGITGTTEAAGRAGGGGRRTALADGMAKVWLDGMRTLSLATSVPQIGAPAAWQAGYDGTGVTVAVLDSGVDTAHPDLVGRIALAENFTGDAEDGRDRYGHGTHVASTIGGSGAASDGRNRGVAPGARLISGKVCVATGDCAESWILAGMQWAAEQGATVVNMSLGGPDSAGDDPMETAVETLTEQYDTLFVAAAGNDGQDASVGSPASADSALAVGAVDSTDALAWFSSRGPRFHDSAVKPDLTGPGVEITAARSADGWIGEPGQPYVGSSGTSMATPHVAGAAALLAQRRPDWSAPQLKAALMGSASPGPDGGVFGHGAGRVDAARAIGQAVTADPPSVSLGHHPAPHGDDHPVTRTLTYRNHGSAPITLDLAVRAGGPDGAPPPAGLFSTSADRVTVPAGGQATVEVTGDTRAVTADGYYTGYLVATAGEQVVRTPLGAVAGPEEHELTLHMIDRAGRPAELYAGTLVRTDAPGLYRLDQVGGTVRLRLPAGRYALLATVYSDPWSGSPDTTVLAQPRLDLTGAQTVPVDARLGRPVTVSVPSTSAVQYLAEVATQVSANGARHSEVVFSWDPARLYTGQLGSATDPALTAKVGAWFAEPTAVGGVNGSPTVYNLAWFVDGHLPTGFTRAVAAADLATVHAEHARLAPGGRAEKYAYAIAPGRMDAGGNVSLLEYETPFGRTEYFNTDGGGEWVSGFDEWTRLDSGQRAYVSGAVGPLTRYRAGREYTERWNRGVFGPALSAPGLAGSWGVKRTDNTIEAALPLFSDGAGRLGSGYTNTSRTALYRDGALVAEEPYLSGTFPGQPDGEAAYRLEATADRTGLVPLSTRVSAAWTFRSAAGPAGAVRPLPLTTVAFDTGLAAADAAPAGRVHPVPLRVVPQPGSAAGPARRLSVAVSFDDGATWREVKVRDTPGGGVMLVPHPAGDGYASLRASVTDADGNTVEQTVIRAYRISGG